jgi:hypothetical protein
MYVCIGECEGDEEPSPKRQKNVGFAEDVD